MVTIHAASAPTRCTLCHGALAHGFRTCGLCGTAYHADCTIRGCPTLGCPGKRPQWRPVRPAPRPSVFLWMVKLSLRLVAVGVIALVLFLAWGPSVVCGPREIDPEQWARGSLKTLVFAQELFREGHKDGDGIDDYAASMEELLDHTGLSYTYSGPSMGYRIRLVRGATPLHWTAVATPVSPDSDLAVFSVNQDGQVRERRQPE